MYLREKSQVVFDIVPIVSLSRKMTVDSVAHEQSLLATFGPEGGFDCLLSINKSEQRDVGCFTSGYCGAAS